MAFSPKLKKPRFAVPPDPNADKVTLLLEQHVPSCINVIQDNYNGRWRIVCESGEWKSVSWTKRGFESALVLATLHAHFLATVYTGIESDYDLEKIQKDLAKALDEEGTDYEL